MRTGIFFIAVAIAGQGSCTGASSETSPDGVSGVANVLGSAPDAAQGAGWPAFRGPNGNGISPESGINRNWAGKAPKVLWQAPLSDDGYAGPACALGMVFIIDHQGTNDIVRAWQLGSGKEIWTYSYPDASSSNYGFSRATPAVADGRVFVVSRLGKVLCLDAKTGKLEWQKDMVADFGGQRPGWDYAGSPIVDGDRVIVTPGAANAAIVALSAKSGEVLLKGGTGAPGYSTPVVAKLNGVKQYVTFLAKKVCGIDAGTGKELWAFPWETNYDVNAATPLVIGDSVFIASGYGKGCAMVDVKGGKPTLRWQNRAMMAHFSSPIYSGGRIYGTGDPGVLSCLNPADGATLWRQNGFEKGGIVGADGMILGMNGSNGDLIMVKIDPSSYQELGRISPLRGQAWTAPIIADKKAIIRTKSAIAVVDLG